MIDRFATINRRIGCDPACFDLELDCRSRAIEGQGPSQPRHRRLPHPTTPSLTGRSTSSEKAEVRRIVVFLMWPVLTERLYHVLVSQILDRRCPGRHDVEPTQINAPGLRETAARRDD
jgi:hypothetical protein